MFISLIMVFDTTYTDKEVTIEINNLVGKPFSFKERFKLGGIGSHRIMVTETSDKLEQYINPGHSIKHINIELRPDGIIVHLKRHTQTYAWTIPYQKLDFESPYTTISDLTHHISFSEPLKHNKGFFKRLEQIRQR